MFNINTVKRRLRKALKLDCRYGLHYGAGAQHERVGFISKSEAIEWAGTNLRGIPWTVFEYETIDELIPESARSSRFAYAHPQRPR